MSKIRIEFSEHGQGVVFVDGEELKDIIGIEFSARVADLNKLTVTLAAETIEIVGKAEVDICRQPNKVYRLGPCGYDPEPVLA